MLLRRIVVQEFELPTSRRLTDCLHVLSAGAGDEDAATVYAELRKVVEGVFREDRKRYGRADDLRNVTTVVHDCWLRLQTRGTPWDSRAHFFGSASITVRRLLVEEARRRQRERQRLSRLGNGSESAQEYVVRVDELLRELAELSPRSASVVSFRLFGGLPTATIAEIEGVSERSVQRDLRFAQAWLKSRLADK
jgi:RNA polymerase sigma factor (TIGR02999 family)